MYRLTNSTSITRLSDGSLIPNDVNNVDYQNYLKWVDDGNLPQPIDAPSNEQIIARLESSVDNYLNEQSQWLRYESIKTIVTYRDDPNPKFKAEGIAGYQLRSAVYTSSIKLLEDVTNGLKEVPTESELIASLPKITDFLQYE